ncbi:MAG: Uma2 family endonuclease [Isosphaeraceae bacterium]
MIPEPLASPSVHRFTVDEYERIILVGALKDPGRVELINGYVVDKMAKTPQLGYSTRKALDALGSLIGPGFTWRSEQPVRIPDHDEPEPDVAIVRGSTEDYAFRVPGPVDVELLIEVSLTSLDQDRGEKRMAYARGRIPVYWIINPVHRQVGVFADPGPDGYGTSTIYREGQSVPVVIGGQPLGEIAVSVIVVHPIRVRTGDDRGKIGYDSRQTKRGGLDNGNGRTGP